METQPEIDMLRYRFYGQERPLLRARGVTIGTIERCSVRIGGAITTANCLEVLGIATETPIYTTSKSESLWRILYADRFCRSNLRRSFNEAKFESLWASLQHSKSERRSNSTLASFSFDIEEYLDDGTSPDGRVDSEVVEYLEMVRSVVWNRRTVQGRRAGNISGNIYGLVPRQARVGDSLCVLYGCSVPIVLRRLQAEREVVRWQLIGEAYVHDFMDGEAIAGGLTAEFDVV
jgi:hypothetical protein